MKKAVYLLARQNFNKVYGHQERADISNRVQIIRDVIEPAEVQTLGDSCHEVEIIFSGWGMAVMDEAFFEHFPNLKILFYGGGAVNRFVTESVWARKLPITTSNSANGVPVAEYTVAQIIMCLKQAYRANKIIKQQRTFIRPSPIIGTYESTIGIISLGAIGRVVVERLSQYQLKIIAYDPYLTQDQANAIGVHLVSLDALFEQADVVTCHTPWLPETVGMIRGSHFAKMKANAAFINTSRGAIVNEPEMIAALQSRTDLFAVLDVTYPEPPSPESPLYDMENVFLTPHIAGSMDSECRRMGRLVIEELDRWLNGQPLKHLVTREYARGIL